MGYFDMCTRNWFIGHKGGTFKLNEQTTSKLKIGVIGSGAAGLPSAKNALEQGHKVTVYEQTGQIGGIW